MTPGDLYATLDALKVADTVLFLETARHWEEGLYPEAELLLTVSMTQGLPSTVVAIMDLETIPKKVFLQFSFFESVKFALTDLPISVCDFRNNKMLKCPFRKKLGNICLMKRSQHLRQTVILLLF